MAKSSHTAKDVAAWMLRELERGRGVLAQDDAAATIESKFGSKFVRINDNGNLSINKTVLAEFRALTEKTVVWERGQRKWRTRERNDATSRLAD